MVCFVLFCFVLSPNWLLSDRVVDLSKLRFRVYPPAREQETKLRKNDNPTPLYLQAQQRRITKAEDRKCTLYPNSRPNLAWIAPVGPSASAIH